VGTEGRIGHGERIAEAFVIEKRVRVEKPVHVLEGGITMRRSGIISLVVVALCAGAMVAPRPAQAMVGDILVMAVEEPNDPNATVPRSEPDPNTPWDPAAHIVATWDSLTSMSKLYNPAQAGAKAPERSLSLAAHVDIIDVNGLIGFDYSATGILVLDDKAGVVYSKPVPKQTCRFYWPLRYTKTMPTPGQWVSQLQPYNLTVNMPFDANRPYPLMLSKVEWSMFALAATEIKTVDVPFQLAADWLTLAPGLEIKVEAITAESSKYEYRLATRYSHSKVIWAAGGAAIALWTQDPTPEVILTKIDVLDPAGRSIVDQASGGYSGSSGGGASGSGDLMTGTYGGSGTCDICGMATTLRFTLALKPAQHELRFLLENVPVPSL
jgi:hypothetical protein